MKDPAISAVTELVGRVHGAENVIHWLTTAWDDLPHHDKVIIGEQYPDLCDAVIKATRIARTATEVPVVSLPPKDGRNVRFVGGVDV